MYYPFLRGKQFEFLALRDLCTELEGHLDKICPIIEPVKNTYRDAFNAFDAMREKRFRFAFILNPSLGDFQHSNDFIYTGDVKLKLPSHEDFWQPAFILQGESTSVIHNISTLIEKEKLKKILVVLPKNEEVDNWMGILQNPHISTIVVANADSKSIIRKVNGLGKHIVRLDDCFQQENRNRDFQGKEDQFFNDNHVYYKEEKFWGFGDYTTMPESYSDGGMLPYVVAIHFTYNKSEDEVWIHHFLSESNANGTENIQTKFREAAQKVEPFFTEGHPQDRTSAIDSLKQYLDNAHYPGLGTLKKLSIIHHLTLMSRYLENSKEQ